MNLEGFSKKHMELGDNPEGIYETRNDIKKQYLDAIKKLALEKMKDNLLFEGILGATIRQLSSIGLNVTRESILKDIEIEINRQKIALNWEQQADEQFKDELLDIFSYDDLPKKEIETDVMDDEINIQIDSLKNNLSRIFEKTPMQEPKISEPTLSVKEQQTSLPKAQEEMNQNLEWGKEQPSEPTMSFTGNLANLSDNVKQEIKEQMESRNGVIISEIDNIYQEGNYIVVDAKDNQGHFTGTEFTLEDFDKIVNQGKYLQQTINSSVPNQEEQIKDKIVDQIMNAMNYAGEFTFGNISMGERMNIMQNVQAKLKAKSLDELQILLASYQEQNVQEDSISSGIRR